ncbi:unnamed protein product [Commensalibacter communis]|uniref:Uncharacterized protein n=1 Tax=Commensalibacter communis TaxID=2972786 RepID=A0A9W4X5H8_9PROT|nr:hypothetical protein [Commensalibacter communis]CAI3922456.1 unnamed protein product [Commensalibacter communis]CAI3923735.1 unnamed protein product [Commensalibacter communis]CAI3938685.1 unnamed protein product [Commensalibacter communis]CAI3939260.1 unnamed protein product [Commensalibacter communis]
MVNNTDVKLSANRAFLGHITSNVRAIAFDYTTNSVFIYAYYDTEPTEDDYEIIDCAVTEILADFPDFQSQEIILTQTNAPIDTLNSYKGWIFIKYKA